MNHPEVRRYAIQLESIDECAWAAAQDAMEEDPELDFLTILYSCGEVLVIGYQLATSEDEALHLAARARGFNDPAEWWTLFNAGDESFTLVAVEEHDEEPQVEW